MDQQDMIDAMLEGEAQLRTAFQLAEQEFTASDMKRQLGLLWNTLPPDAKNYVKTQNPDQYKQVSDFLQLK
jgi:hypothetical protein